MILSSLCALLFGGMSVFENGRIASDIAPLVLLGLVVRIGGRLDLGGDTVTSVRLTPGDSRTKFSQPTGKERIVFWRFLHILRRNA
ncbi:hypothetical protein JJB98_02105 [Bradyrhizobium diazoefficiens]|nr:hypothetical protein [Bradyrhizobium diazoefficiens]QQO18795.1 hypothetical protein JJB98_02105 [Bradyrhizobium diazoefficiens]